MKITNYIPTNDWRDLQNQVSNFLNEAGYSAETEKEIDTVRGTVEVDVFAASKYEMLNQFICECKCWNTNVPQEKIHAFRTVVSDSGSMLGIFIVKKGYQKGAYEAARKSNVLLKTWEEFIAMIENQWLIRKIIKINKLISPLAVYTDPLDVPLDKLNTKKLEHYQILNIDTMGNYITLRMMDMDSMNKDFIEFDGIKFTAYDDLFNYAEDYIVSVKKQFENIFSETEIEEYKFEFTPFPFRLADDLVKAFYD
ncbi:restriction endonuclease [Aerococcus urinaeequi]|uniref:restriction endonuclease n=1 Tax=Aerococcus urinaeequi TaxID=51665 RepID=UPI000740F921|nr:restriction endonuclease [Aerococcus urinaeequi]MDT2761437.1 restriction endonuclease [Aerococcus urinaeequi]